MNQPKNSGHDSAGVNDTVDRLKVEAAATLRELRGDGGLKRFFEFDRMYFPLFARTLFLVICAVSALFGVVGVIGSLVWMARQGFLDGCFMLAGVVVGVVVMIIMARVWIELSLVAFKINDRLLEIRDLLRDKER